MASLNKVLLIGNVGKDPEIKTLASGNKVANITLATSERYKDRNGEKHLYAVLFSGVDGSALLVEQPLV